MSLRSVNSFNTRTTLDVKGKRYTYFSLPALREQGLGDVNRLPYSLRILLENLLRHEDGIAIRRDDIEALVNWDPSAQFGGEIAFSPARVILQDFTGVPAVVDLAVMRDAMQALGGNPSKINPQIPSELVIDHSVQVDSFGQSNSLQTNIEQEFGRNRERYAFLRWGQSSFDNFRVVPPATGIVHQVNLEYLGRVVFDDSGLAFPDTLVGTDSHTTMINGLGILGWGVGGIEAEAAMLGQPISLLVPQVVGFRLEGILSEGSTATDLVLTITDMLRKKGVVGKFVEFYGPGISSLSLADRATLGNMSPEYGATCAVFPVDAKTIDFLKFTARNEQQISLVEGYMKAQDLFHDGDTPDPEYSDTLALDLGDVEPSIAGPKRPHDRILLKDSGEAFEDTLTTTLETVGRSASVQGVTVRLDQAGQPDSFELRDGAVVFAAITSCTNTSNPSVMIAAGLLAKKAVEAGLRRKPWVKTSLAPGSKVVSAYLEAAGLQDYLDALGFNLVGYGCTTCIGNSGPLPEPISRAIRQQNLIACSVLSGNRNFEGRISPDVRANYLASPPLVVAYALVGRMNINLDLEPLGEGTEGNGVYLRDIWPSQKEIRDAVRDAVKTEMYAQKYADVFTGDERWNELPASESDLFQWDFTSTYIRKPSFFEGVEPTPTALGDLLGMKVLALLGDSVTTDHISPAGVIPVDSPAGQYLLEHGVQPQDFNSFGSRRGNHEVMVRGTFGNIRLRNLLVPGIEGGYTVHSAHTEAIPIYDAAMRYKEEAVPLLVIAGKEYGTGSSRDWAAKGTCLLGVRAVLAESFERIHRSNLIGMGVLPLQFLPGENAESLALNGGETFDLIGLTDGLEPGQELNLRATIVDGRSREFSVIARVDTPNEVQYYRNGGILHYVLRSLLQAL